MDTKIQRYMVYGFFYPVLVMASFSLICGLISLVFWLNYVEVVIILACTVITPLICLISVGMLYYYSIDSEGYIKE